MSSVMRILMAVLASLVAGSVLAQQADGKSWGVTATQSLVHESNLLRLPSTIPSSAVIPGASGNSDFYTLTRLGADFDRTYSKQRLQAQVGTDITRFSNFSRFDSVGYNLFGRYDWQYDRNWYGHAQLGSSRSRSTFVDFRSSEPNLVNTQSIGTAVGFRFTPVWSTYVGLDTIATDNSVSPLKPNNLESTNVEAGLRYQPEDGTDLFVLARRSDGRFPNRQTNDVNGNPLPNAIDNSFIQNELLIRGVLSPSTVARYQGQIGLTQRRHENFPIRDFSGLTFQLDYNWNPQGLWSFQASAGNTIGAVADVSANYIVSRFIVLRPALSITPKTQLRGSFEWRDRQFSGDPGLAVSNAPKREDRLTTVGIGVSSTINRSWSWGADLRQESRNSNAVNQDFSARVFAVSATIQF
jgi:hypothetical protein